jgi:hypothetical protein
MRRPELAEVALLGELRVITAHTEADLAVHLPAWDRLAWEAPQALPNLMPSWVRAFLRHRLRPDERWFCSFAYRSDRLVGVLPVVVTPQPLLGSGRPMLRTIFEGETASGDVLLPTDQPAQVLQPLLCEARRQVPGHTGVAFRFVRQNSPLWKALDKPAPGYVICRGEEVGYSLLDLRDGCAKYLSANMRRNLKRLRKKLDGRGPVEMSIGLAAGTEGPLEEFLALEAAGWKGRSGGAILARPHEAAFFAELLGALGAQGRLEWHTLRVNGRLIAAGFGVRCKDALILPKIAYDEQFADCGPGDLLTHAVMVDASARGAREINHLSRADWHRYWHMDEDRYRDVYLVRSAAVPLIWELPGIASRRVMRHAKDQVERRWPEAAKAYRRFHRGSHADESQGPANGSS